MGLPAARLDHLVVAAQTLDQGTEYVLQCLGVEPSGGGRHAGMGTHNRVLKLGRNQYLEVIAVDPEAPPPVFPRWFNLNDPSLQARLKRRPRLIAWVARTDAIDTLAAAIGSLRLTVRPMQRGPFRWRFAFTVDGVLPEGGLIPHLIQWDSPNHPAESMPCAGLRLVSLNGVHADPETVKRVIASMGLGDAIAIHPASGERPPGLSARIETPDGEVELD